MHSSKRSFSNNETLEMWREIKLIFNFYFSHSLSVTTNDSNKSLQQNQPYFYFAIFLFTD